MPNLTRREFLKSKLLLAGALATGVDMINGTAQLEAASLAGYKALVCVYLAGGNDSFNMFVPRSNSAHADYADARQFLTVSQSRLLAVNPATYSDGQSYGFHPAMTNAQSLFGRGDLAVIANVGSLIRPISKQEYEAGSGAIPAELFSHNSQTDSWLAADARGGAGQGWAGRTMDIMYPSTAPRPSPSISVGGNALWQTGQRVRAFEVGRNGVGSTFLPNHTGPLKLRDAFRVAHQNAIAHDNLFLSEHAATLGRAEDFTGLVNYALGFAPTFAQPFDEAPLAQQLQMVARLIAVRDRLDTNTRRQVFFVRLGGWDTHNSQLADSDDSGHPALLRQLDRALGSFQAALTELGEQNSVTTFTATEFGRSLTPNGSGTDHGWGGHNLVMGGAVQGADIYGLMPQLTRDSIDTVANNRVIPTTSVDQYSATMARWFGLNSSEIASVFPNLRNFSQSDLGFLV